MLADPGARTLSIEDTGAGLTDAEIRSYLATVGAGYTRTLRQRGENTSLIGYFGLGFLSAFVVAERTEVWTCSYQDPAQAWRFVSHDGQTYSLEPGPERAVGTRVTLHLREQHEALANPLAVRRLLTRYTCLLQHPIHCPLDASLADRSEGLGEPVNAEPPPWRGASSPSSSSENARTSPRHTAEFEAIPGARARWRRMPSRCSRMCLGRAEKGVTRSNCLAVCLWSCAAVRAPKGSIKARREKVGCSK